MRATMIALTCFALAGCASQRWVKPGASAADFEQDKVACQYEASKATGNMSTGGDPIAAGIDQGFRQNEIATLCLRTKGWNLERAAAQ